MNIVSVQVNAQALLNALRQGTVDNVDNCFDNC